MLESISTNLVDIVNFAVHLILPFIGGFFVAVIAFRKAWKGNVTTLKLAGFTATFVFSFVLILIATFYLWQVPFGR